MSDVFQYLYENAPIAYVALGADGRIERVNIAGTKLLQADSESLIGRPLESFVVAEDQPSFVEYMQSLLHVPNTSNEDDLDIRMQGLDGELVFVRVKCLQHPIPSRPGKQTHHLYLCLTDISEIKAARLETKSQLVYAEAIVNTIREGLLVLDQDLKVVSASRRFYETFQLKKDDIVGQHLGDIDDGAWDVDELIDELVQVLPSQKAITQYELIQTFPRVGKQHMMVNAQPFEGHEKALVLVALHDVSELNEVKTAHQHTESMLALALKGADIILYHQDLDLRYTWLHNPRPDFSLEVALGKRHSDIAEREEEAIDFDRFAQDVIDRGYPNQEILVSHYQGKPRYYNVRAEPTRDEAGTITGVTCAAIDVTKHMVSSQREQFLKELTTKLASAKDVEEVAIEFIRAKLQLSASRVVVAVAPDGENLDTGTDHTLTAYMGENDDIRVQTIHIDSILPASDVYLSGSPLWIETPEDIEQSYQDLASWKIADTTTRSLACLPLIIDNHVVGAITLWYDHQVAFTEDYKDFLLAIATLCATASNLVQVRKIARDYAIVQARQQLARDLHDAISQALFSAQMLSEGLPRLYESDPDRLAHGLLELNRMLRSAQAEMRILLFELRPDQLEDGSLTEHLTYLAEQTEIQSQTEIYIEIAPDIILDPNVKVALYRITQEALNNIIKHADSQHIEIRLTVNRDLRQLVIIDDGNGFNVDTIAQGFGLVSMRERAESIDAILTIQSTIGQGTQITVVW
ncbi:MAG: hypothetical protein CL607_24190 [Anaerolineaceae bacterium]|nr:hypothetical protein [Anaerolineaceae bacterium]